MFAHQKTPRQSADAVIQPIEPALNQLRFAMRTCRAKGRVDTFRACATFNPDPVEAETALAQLLVRVLGRELRRPPVFHAPGTPETSFDEDWIIRILDRVRANDQSSIYFLLSSRLGRTGLRNISSLFYSLAKRD